MDPSIHPSTSGWTHRESLCLSVVTRHPNRMYRDLHGNHHSTWIPGSSPLVVDTTSCCCPSLLTYTTCGAWLSSSSLCESVSSMLMDSSGVLRWIPSIWSSGDVHPGWWHPVLGSTDPVHGVGGRPRALHYTLCSCVASYSTWP